MTICFAPSVLKIFGKDHLLSLYFLIRCYDYHYWTQVFCRVPMALGKGLFAHGKHVAGCRRSLTANSAWQSSSRQRRCLPSAVRRVHGKPLPCASFGSRQKRGSRWLDHDGGRDDGHFAECQDSKALGKVFKIVLLQISLPCVHRPALGNYFDIFVLKIFTLPCACMWHSAKTSPFAE